MYIVVGKQKLIKNFHLRSVLLFYSSFKSRLRWVMNYHLPPQPPRPRGAPTKARPPHPPCPTPMAATGAIGAMPTPTNGAPITLAWQETMARAKKTAKIWVEKRRKLLDFSQIFNIRTRFFSTYDYFHGEKVGCWFLSVCKKNCKKYLISNALRS